MNIIDRAKAFSTFVEAAISKVGQTFASEEHALVREALAAAVHDVADAIHVGALHLLTPEAIKERFAEALGIVGEVDKAADGQPATPTAASSPAAPASTAPAPSPAKAATAAAPAVEHTKCPTCGAMTGPSGGHLTPAEAKACDAKKMAAARAAMSQPAPKPAE